MTDRAVAGPRRCMNDRLLHSQFSFVVALIAKRCSGFLQAQHSHQPVRFVARQAVLVLERLVFHLPFEITSRMALQTVTFRGKTLPAFHLRAGISQRR